MLLLCLVALICSVAFGEVSVTGAPQTIYDRSPKIRLKGSGFDAEDHDITLEISASGQPPLKVDKDFTLTKDDDGEGVLLKLVAGRRYAFLLFLSYIWCEIILFICVFVSPWFLFLNFSVQF